MTNHIYATEEYSILNATTHYDDSNGSYPYYDATYGSTEYFNTSLNET